MPKVAFSGDFANIDALGDVKNERERPAAVTR
jgi:hypothetical protein